MITKSKGKGIKKYECADCEESWVGLTNRVASRPLNPAAVACANEEVYKSCPRLTDSAGVRRRITFSRDDYLCRRKWMDAYTTCLAEPPAPPPAPEPRKVVITCPFKPPPPVVTADKKCALVEISAECDHHGEGARLVREGMTLGVVPSTYGSDTIVLNANVQKPCGTHPIWTISENSSKQEIKTSFSATGPVLAKALFFIPSISPRSYQVTCSTCYGDFSLQVDAYPPNELQFNLDAKKGISRLFKVIKKILDLIEKAVNTLSEKFKWDYLVGKLNVEAAWKEYKDYRAYYAYKFDIKMAPFIGGTFTFKIGPTKLKRIVGKIPGIGKYFERAVDWLMKADVFVKMSGGINCEIKAERSTPDQPKFPLELGAGAGGKVEIAVGVEGGVLGDENGVVYVALEAAGAIPGGGKPFLNDEGYGLEEFKIELEAVKGTFKLCLLHGLVDISPNIVLIEAPDKPLYGPTTWYFHRNGEEDDE